MAVSVSGVFLIRYCSAVDRSAPAADFFDISLLNQIAEGFFNHGHADIGALTHNIRFSHVIGACIEYIADALCFRLNFIAAEFDARIELFVNRKDRRQKIMNKCGIVIFFVQPVEPALFQ